MSLTFFIVGFSNRQSVETTRATPNNKSAASLTPFRALRKQSIHYGGRRIDSSGSGREGTRFGESVTPRFAEMGCRESRPNPAGNEPAPTKRSTGLTTPRPAAIEAPRSARASGAAEQAISGNPSHPEAPRRSCPPVVHPAAPVQGPRPSPPPHAVQPRPVIPQHLP